MIGFAIGSVERIGQATDHNSATPDRQTPAGAIGTLERPLTAAGRDNQGG
jgi:hypothetical protein